MKNNGKVSLEIENIYIEGSYQKDESSSEIPFDGYAQIDCSGWKEIYIKGNPSSEIPKGREILFYIYQENIELFVNDELIYSSKGDESSRWDYVVSPGIKKSDKIVLHMSKIGVKQYEDSFKITYSKLYQGNRYSLLQMETSNHKKTILLSLLVFVSGIAVVLSTLALLALKVPMVRGYLSCGILMIVGGACCFINYDYITLLFSHARLVNILDVGLQLAIVLSLTLYLKSYIKNKSCKNIVEYFVYLWSLGMTVYFILHSIKMEGTLIHGIVILLSLMTLAFLVIILCVEYYVYQNIQAKEVLWSSFFLIACTLIEMIHYYFTHIWWINVFLIGVFGFTVLQLAILVRRSKESIDKVEKAKQMEKELLTSRMSQMSHQIRPHFVYNVMTTISCLCEENPLVARDMVDEFSDYLRANVDSMNDMKPIPFQQELRNMNTYYSLEKIRFENKMDISWLLEEDDFKIPAFTIEPLVENSIKHGVNYKEGILHIVVTTRNHKEYIEVTVEDDGPGFDVNEKKNDGREHVGLINIQKRLELMIHATMSIESKIGEGTKVSIKIPKTKQEENSENTGDR